MNYMRTPNAGYPPTTHKAVTLDQQFDFPCQYLFVGTSGNIALTDLFGNTVTWTNVQAGEILWGQWTKVNTTGTTAGSMVYAY